MYGKGIAMSAGTGSAGALAYTGMTVAWLVVAGLMLVMAGAALLKFIPRAGQEERY